MTVCNIDLVIFEGRNDIMRFIESKHENEQDSEYAERVFNKIVLNYGIEFYKVIGSPPYEEVKIYDYFSDETKTVKQSELKRFLQCELDFDDL